MVEYPPQKTTLWLSGRVSAQETILMVQWWSVHLRRPPWWLGYRLPQETNPCGAVFIVSVQRDHPVGSVVDYNPGGLMVESTIRMPLWWLSGRVATSGFIDYTIRFNRFGWINIYGIAIVVSAFLKAVPVHLYIYVSVHEKNITNKVHLYNRHIFQNVTLTHQRLYLNVLK